MKIKFYTKKFLKIIDSLVKNKKTNHNIKKALRRFARFTLKNFFHYIRLRVLYYIFLKKKLSELLFTTNTPTKGNLYDIYCVLENLVKRRNVKKI